MTKEKFGNEPQVFMGTICPADHGRATDGDAITKHAALNDYVSNMSVDKIDKVLGVVFLKKCAIVRSVGNPFLMPAEDSFSTSDHGFAVGGRIERGIVGITGADEAMRTDVETLHKLLDGGRAYNNVGLFSCGTKRDQTDIASVLALCEGVGVSMPGDNATINVELIAPIAMEKELHFAGY
jgi:translation elongation factor EF-Tu-like GTPase